MTFRERIDSPSATTWGLGFYAVVLFAFLYLPLGVIALFSFVDNTVGPQAENAFGFRRPIGGSVKTVGSLELFFPRLFDSPSARISAFLDFGNVYRDWDSFDASEMRASAGAALLWRSPMGPISISYAFPLRTLEGDRTERLQFTFGGQF